jgi:hypothetical protein
MAFVFNIKPTNLKNVDDMLMGKKDVLHVSSTWYGMVNFVLVVGDCCDTNPEL